MSWRLFGGIALIVLVALGASFWLFTAEVERLRDDELTGQLLAEARLLGYALRGSWVARDVRPIAGMVYALHEEGTDVIVMAAGGTVLENTTGGEDITADLLQQAESQSALRQGWGQATRAGIHGAAPSRAVAVRIGSDLEELGVIWLARPCWSFATQARRFGPVIAAISVIALATIVGLGLALTRRWTGLLRRLRQAAQSLSQGNLSARAEASGSDEFALLAQSLNEMRRRLLVHTETVTRQRETLEALLDQLQEGVIAAGADGRIILINQAAVRLLNLQAEGGDGNVLVQRPLEQCLPQYELQNLLRTKPGTDAERTPAGAPTAEERQLRVETPTGTVHVLARASELRLPPARPEETASSAGRLVVLTDITALRRALQMQTDFVANASHELRTPISSIRVAVETLAQMNLAQSHPDAGQFIDMIERNSARLAAMAADLLDVSRLQSHAARTQASDLNLGDLLRDLTARFADAVRTKGVHWQVDWEPADRRTLVANSHLLRLALDNLVDNAIQFVEPGGHVSVVCRASSSQVTFEIVDDGCGIPEADQQRVFERFYQVERARSGPRRGTGLGLAIVRDAVAAMRGTVRLQSQVGAGTRVTVTLP